MTLDYAVVLDTTPNTQTTGKQTNKQTGKLDFIKSKNLCFSRDTIKKVKRQCTERERIFALYIR